MTAKDFVPSLIVVSLAVIGGPVARAGSPPAPADLADFSLPAETYPPYTEFEPEAQQRLFQAIAQARASRQEWPSAQPVVPIFVITCDRLNVLIRSLVSYFDCLDSPIEIIIHDNNTTYPPTIAFLNALQEAGVLVYRHARNITHDRSLSDVSQTIDHWYASHDAPYYIVTDPDIEMEPADADLLPILQAILDTFPWINVSGPMLRDDDLPDHYPLKAKVIQSNLELYPVRPAQFAVWDDTPIMVKAGYIDSVFGMYRKGFRFHNYNPSLQTPDFRARHLDWYLDPANLTHDQMYYWKKANPVGHYGSTWLRR